MNEHTKEAIKRLVGYASSFHASNVNDDIKLVEEWLKNQPKEGDEIRVVWCIDDVKGQAEDNDITLTDDECREVLRRADAGHDATIGINWDVLDFHIDEVVEARKK